MSNRLTKALLLILVAAIGICHYEMKKRPSTEEIQEISSIIEQFTRWQAKFSPDFEVELLDGKQFKISDSIGKKVIILNFFATWCKPCRAEVPELNRFYQKYKSERLIMVGINANEAEDTVKQFITDQKLSFPVGIDNEAIIQNKYGVKSYPTTVFIGVDGRIALYEIGAISNADIAFERLYRLNMRMLDSKRGIDKETYLEMVKLQESEAEEGEDDELKLEGRAREFAEKMHCPSCGRSLIECNGRVSIKIKKKLAKMELDNKADEEILKELFLVASKSND